MNTGTEPRTLDAERLDQAIDKLIAAIRTNQSGVDEVAALTTLVSQLRDANQNLVLATLKAQVLQEEAEMRNRQQIEFLAMLAHELRNPLAPISNAANLLGQIVSAHPVLPRIQGVISRQVEHMAHLIDDLLDASRITSGKIALQKTRIQLNDIIEHSIQMVRPSMEQRSQKFITEPLPRTVWMDGDLVRLSQALSNLLANASKFTPEGGQISLNIRQRRESVRITVKDNGMGIEPELLPHIFDLFKQGPCSLARSEGGLGIGLSVAKALVEMHGGEIFVHSHGQDTGTEFTIVLPVLESATAEPPSSAAQPEQMLPANGRRILLIEDNPDTNSTLQLLLELEGHQVTPALDGLTGLSLARENRYDLLICDIGLPGLDGYELISQLRQQSERPRPFAIALSGYGQPEDLLRAMNAGFDEYMVKPVKGNKLIRLIASQAALP